jgi:hypothetical protein
LFIVIRIIRPQTLKSRFYALGLGGLPLTQQFLMTGKESLNLCGSNSSQRRRWVSAHPSTKLRTNG